MDIYLHGECVSIGMAYESYIAADLGILSYKDYRRIVSCLTGLFEQFAQEILFLV